jgi:hypothetical protein
VQAGRSAGSRPYGLGVRYLRVVAAWLLAAPLAGFALVRLFGVEHGWPLVPLLAFTPYAALAGAVPVATGFLLRQRWAAGVALVATVTLAGLVLPRALGGPEHHAGPPLHVLSANLRVGGADPERLLDLVRTGHVDLLALQEFTFAARDRLVAAGLGALLPYGASHPTDGVDGSALYSRYPLTDTGFRPFPGGFGQAYATLRVPGAPPVLVESVHPASPSAGDQLGYWRAGLADEPRATPARTGTAAARRLQRDPGPRPAASPDRLRVPGRRLRGGRRVHPVLALRRQAAAPSDHRPRAG